MKEVKYIFSHKVLTILFIFIFILTLTPFLIDGRNGCIGKICGLFMGDMRDGVWFDAVSAISFKTFPFQMPNYSGQILRGYHFLPNLFAFLINKATHLPYYSIRLTLFPALYLISITILTVKMARKIHNDHRFVFLFCLFFLLGGPLRILTAIYNLNLSEFWNSFMINTFDAINIMVSPHTAFSHVLLLLLINNLLNKKITYKMTGINLCILFLLFGTKFYTAFIAVIILFVYTVLNGIEGKKIRAIIINIVFLILVVVISYFVFYKTNTVGSNPVFVWAPFALAHHIIENPRKFFFSNDLTLQRYYLYSNTKNFSLRLLAIELYSSSLFLIFYLGARSLGLLYIFITLKDVLKNKFWFSMLVAVIPTIFIPLMFIQRGTWFDTAQFLVAGSFLLSIFAAQFVYLLIQKRGKVAFIVCVIILSLFFFQNLSVGRIFFNTNKAMISQEEIIALDILKKAPAGTVFYPISNGDSPYVNALSEKQSFLNYTHVLENVGIDYSNRKRIVENADIDGLSKLGVAYLYIPTNYPSNEKIYFTLLNKMIKKSNKYNVLYKNEKVAIYKHNNL